MRPAITIPIANLRGFLVMASYRSSERMTAKAKPIQDVAKAKTRSVPMKSHATTATIKMNKTAA